MAVSRQTIRRAPSGFPKAFMIVYLSTIQSGEVDEVASWIAGAFYSSDDGVGSDVLGDY